MIKANEVNRTGYFTEGVTVTTEANFLTKSQPTES